MNLSPSQRKYLRALAHPLKPVVVVGREGVTEPLMAEVERALDDHELIKIRFGDFKEEKVELSSGIVQQSGAVMAGMIGHVVIMYRPRRDPTMRKIRLP